MVPVVHETCNATDIRSSRTQDSYWLVEKCAADPRLVWVGVDYPVRCRHVVSWKKSTVQVFAKSLRLKYVHAWEQRQCSRGGMQHKGQQVRTITHDP